jgi:hypothetical protein
LNWNAVTVMTTDDSRIIEPSDCSNRPDSNGPIHCVAVLATVTVRSPCPDAMARGWVPALT